MIKRIVKMTFVPGNEEAFMAVYKESREKIRGFAGCEHVELLRDVKQQNIFFTFSRWQSEEHLNAYRKSELFAGVWTRTRALFSEKAEAWTVNEMHF